jgi:hypothetical protein
MRQTRREVYNVYRGYRNYSNNKPIHKREVTEGDEAIGFIMLAGILLFFAGILINVIYY